MGSCVHARATLHTFSGRLVPLLTWMCSQVGVPRLTVVQEGVDHQCAGRITIPADQQRKGRDHIAGWYTLNRGVLVNPVLSRALELPGLQLELSRSF